MWSFKLAVTKIFPKRQLSIKNKREAVSINPWSKLAQNVEKMRQKIDDRKVKFEQDPKAKPSKTEHGTKYGMQDWFALRFHKSVEDKYNDSIN